MNQITAEELERWAKTGKDFLLIDIREVWERELFHIGGIHMPFSDIPGSAGGIPKDRDVVLYCEKGIRSVIAIQRLECSGFHNLFNLSGGVKAWKLHAGLSL